MKLDLIPLPVEPIPAKGMAAAPLRMGMAISNMADLLAGGTRPGLGTLCCFAYPIGQGMHPQPVLLGNDHVLHAHEASQGSLVFQPGIQTQDEKMAFPADEMRGIAVLTGQRKYGHHDYAYPGESALPYFIDVAMASLLPEACIFQNTVADGPSAQKVTKASRMHPSDVSLGGRYRVWKQGAATGRTEGVVLSIRGEVHGPDGEIRRNVIIIQSAAGSQGQPFCNDGDSGAPLFNTRGQLVGMVWGKDPARPEIGYASPIHPILDAMQVILAQPYHKTSSRHSTTPESLRP